MVVLFAAIGLTAVFTDNRVVLTSDLALVPLALLVCLLWGLALGLFLAAATVYFRDLQHLIEIVLLALFWLVPIVYPVVLPIKNFTETGHTFLLQVYLANPDAQRGRPPSSAPSTRWGRSTPSPATSGAA